MNKSNDMTGKTEYQAFEEWWVNDLNDYEADEFGIITPKDAFYIWQSACAYKDAQYRPRYEESEDAVYINGRKFYGEKVVKQLEEELRWSKYNVGQNE